MKSNFTSFTDYIRHEQDRIANTREDLTLENRERIVSANSPAEFIPTETDHGILLVHGLYDSPYGMKSFYDRLTGTGRYHVRSLLLPGHGTVPSDLLNVTLEEWSAALRFGIQTFPKNIRRITLIGHSLGAGLSLQAAVEGLPIHRLVMVAPPIRLNNPIAHYARYYRPVAKWFPRANWYRQVEETNFGKYQSITFNSVEQVSRLSDEIHYATVPCPLLTVLSSEDEVISTPAALEFLKRQTPSMRRSILFSRDEKITLPFPEMVLEHSQDLKNRILDYSHNCLMNAPDHPYYGQHGDWLTEQHDPTAYFGALSLKNCFQYRVIRLCYNPKFEWMYSKIVEFIDAPVIANGVKQSSSDADYAF